MVNRHKIGTPTHCHWSTSIYHSVLNVKALEGAFNQEKALIGGFSVIVKTGCGTDGSFYSTTLQLSIQPRHPASDCPLLPFIYIGYLSLKCSIVRLRQNKWSYHIQLLYTVPGPGSQTYNVMKNSNDSAASRPFLSFHLDFVCHSLSLFPDGRKT